jgi:glycerate 2-kinase
LSGAHASALVSRALDNPPDIIRAAKSVHLLAVGKASAAMAQAFVSRSRPQIAGGLVVVTRADTAVLEGLAVQRGAHPVPDADSVIAGRRALALAANPSADCFVVLLSGGASSMMAVPAEGLSLADKQDTTRLLLAHDADIHQINCVRKHLSAIKGGRLARVCSLPVVTMAISDVVGDDLSVIGSAPTVPDASTYQDALAIVGRYGGERVPASVLRHLERGARGEIAETPKPAGEHTIRRDAMVIGSSADALLGARQAAEALGYEVKVLGPVTGEAMEAASKYIDEIAMVAAKAGKTPVCILSAGETTVHVTGHGRGGRNQQFALAAAPGLARLGRFAALESVGTDGVDGPTDAAGALADSTTVARARARGLDPMQYLGENDAWTFFSALGDLVRTGETHTNVGDIQVTLIAPPGDREAS